MFTTLKSAGMQSVHLFADQRSGLEALVAIHSTRLGPALGGCRYQPYASFDQALQDALRLAQGMSHKAALAGLPFGGGKAVILRAPHIDNRASLFEAFGRCIESLRGGYITSVDSGTGSADMDCVAQQTRYVTATSQAGDPSPLTAMGVLEGIRAAAAERLGSASLNGVRVALQGLGSVGYALAEMLVAEGAEVMAGDIDEGRVQLAVEELGIRALAAAAVSEAPCDIFAPCALGGVLDATAIDNLRCAVVAGAANNQLQHAADAERLLARGILYAPDYVINAGGLLHVALGWQGRSASEIAAQVMQIGPRLTDLFVESRAEARTPLAIAERRAAALLAD